MVAQCLEHRFEIWARSFTNYSTLGLVSSPKTYIAFISSRPNSKHSSAPHSITISNSILQTRHARTHACMHARTHIHAHTRANTHIHAPPSPFRLSLFDVSVEPNHDGVNAPFSPILLAINDRSLLHSNKRLGIRDSFGCFSRIHKCLGRTENS